MVKKEKEESSLTTVLTTILIVVALVGVFSILKRFEPKEKQTTIERQLQAYREAGNVCGEGNVVTDKDWDSENERWIDNDDFTCYDWSIAALTEEERASRSAARQKEIEARENCIDFNY